MERSYRLNPGDRVTVVQHHQCTSGARFLGQTGEVFVHREYPQYKGADGYVFVRFPGGDKDIWKDELELAEPTISDDEIKAAIASINGVVVENQPDQAVDERIEGIRELLADYDRTVADPTQARDIAAQDLLDDLRKIVQETGQ